VSFDVEAAAVVSSDGLPMASALPPDVEEDRLAAMSAALLSLGERAAQGLDKGELAQVYVEGSDGNVVLMAAGPHAVLVAMTARHAKAGLVLYEMRTSARRIERIFEEPPNPRRGYERDDAVARHSIDPTPAPPPDPSPYTAAGETESARPSWEDQTIQETPGWEAQPVPSTDWVSNAEESLEPEPWGQDQADQPQADQPQADQPQESAGSIDERDREHEVAAGGHENDQPWSTQQPQEAQQEDPPRQRDDEPKDESSSFTSW
jgi:predicted regulator of Ras-like GTPase activity (Roadblock/LC7/MglB family)